MFQSENSGWKNIIPRVCPEENWKGSISIEPGVFLEKYSQKITSFVIVDSFNRIPELFFNENVRTYNDISICLKERISSWLRKGVKKYIMIGEEPRSIPINIKPFKENNERLFMFDPISHSHDVNFGNTLICPDNWKANRELFLKNLMSCNEMRIRLFSWLAKELMSLKPHFPYQTIEVDCVNIIEIEKDYQFLMDSFEFTNLFRNFRGQNPEADEYMEIEDNNNYINNNNINNNNTNNNNIRNIITQGPNDLFETYVKFTINSGASIHSKNVVFLKNCDLDSSGETCYKATRFVLKSNQDEKEIYIFISSDDRQVFMLLQIVNNLICKETKLTNKKLLVFTSDDDLIWNINKSWIAIYNYFNWRKNVPLQNENYTICVDSPIELMTMFFALTDKTQALGSRDFKIGTFWDFFFSGGFEILNFKILKNKGVSDWESSETFSDEIFDQYGSNSYVFSNHITQSPLRVTPDFGSPRCTRKVDLTEETWIKFITELLRQRGIRIARDNAHTIIRRCYWTLGYFVNSGQNSQINPIEMCKEGYSFWGWYHDDRTGQVLPSIYICEQAGLGSADHPICRSKRNKHRM